MKLVVAPGIWLAHFTTVYVLLSLVCAGDVGQTTSVAADVVRVGVGLASGAAFALLAGAAWADARRLRKVQTGPAAFVARVSVLLSGLSMLAVAWVAYPAFVLPACAA